MTPRRRGLVAPALAGILEVLPRLIEPSEGWALMGGTALAEYYLGHRESEDLDLFALQDGGVADLASRLASALPEALPCVTVETQLVSPSLRRVWVATADGERVKVELIQDAPPRSEAATDVDGVPVASLTDIAAGKLGAFVTGDEPRDLIDLWAIERIAGTPIPGYYPFLFEKDPGLAAYPQAIAEAWQRHGRRTFVPPLVLHITPDEDLRAFCRDQERALIRFLRGRID